MRTSTRYICRMSKGDSEAPSATYCKQTHRVWLCDSSEFERRLVRFGDGFCGHAALAIRRAIDEGHIMPTVE